MSRFFKRERDVVDDALRSARHEAPDAFVKELGVRIGTAQPTAPRRFSRVAFVSAFAVLMLGSFASFGGLSYAAAGAENTVHTVKRAIAPAKSTSVAQRTVKSAAQDQYGEDEVEEQSTAPSSNDKNGSAPAVVVQVAGATGGSTPAATTSGTLPFTGAGLGLTAAIGSALLALGVYLRRREAAKQ